jgi:hypothetical protein
MPASPLGQLGNTASTSHWHTHEHSCDDADVVMLEYFRSLHLYSGHGQEPDGTFSASHSLGDLNSPVLSTLAAALYT